MKQFPEPLCPLVIVALSIACYWNSLGGGLVFDDNAAIRDNRDIRPHSPLINIFFNDFWGTPLRKEQSHKSYRPLTTLTFRLNYAVHGLQPCGYHLVNVLLHTLVCLLYYRMCLMFLPVSTSLAAAALFTTHPIHTEAVAGIVGRAELLSAVFYLSAFIHYTGGSRTLGTDFRRCMITSILAALGMLCKEQALTVLAVCCVYEISSARVPWTEYIARTFRKDRGTLPHWVREVMARVLLLILFTLLILCLRVRIVGPHFPVFSRFDNPASVSASPIRQLTYNYLLSVNVWLLLFPSDLCCDWTMSTIPLVKSVWDARNLATIGVYGGPFFLVRTAFNPDKPRLEMAVSLAMMALSFLPASNLFFPVGFVVAERVLYLPSMGFCMLVAQGWSALWDKSSHKSLALGSLIVLVTLHVLKTTLRNQDWSSELSLFSSALKVNRENSKILNNMGQALEAADRHEEALRYYREAIRVQPDDIRGYLNLGRALTMVTRYREAEEAYLQAKYLLPQPGKKHVPNTRVTTTHLQLFLNLASLVAQNHSRLEEADALYRQAIDLRSDFPNAYLNRGEVLLRMNRTKEAEAMYERALEIDNTNPDLYYNLGVVIMDQGRTEEALELFNRALDIDPEHEKALVNSAVLIQEAGFSSQRSVAIDRLKKAVEQGQANERVFFNLGMLALENRDTRSAETWFRKAAEVTPNSPSTLFNLALLLSDQKKHSDAIVFLKRLLQYHPDHTKGLLLLGDIHFTHMRDLDGAEECYRRVLRLQPHDMQALHNLCVVYLERGHVQRAEQCFAEAASLYPGVQFIRRHLEVTRDLLSKQTLPPPHDQEANYKHDSSLLQDLVSSTAVR